MRTLFAAEMGALVNALGELDGLVFTAWIGAPCTGHPLAVCDRLDWLWLRLDEAADTAGADRISAADSSIDVRLIVTDEEAMITYHHGPLSI